MQERERKREGGRGEGGERERERERAGIFHERNARDFRWLDPARRTRIRSEVAFRSKPI